MLLKTHPTEKLSGSIILPASKSYSIRAYIIAACGGKSLIVNPSRCDDALVAKEVAKAFGSRIKKVSDNSWAIDAMATKHKLDELQVKESGTTLRFVLPLAAIHSDKSKILGTGTLVGRPNTF
ncbi:MAG: 3-phosphoshikimate 1-carboxyvinyltransferase, partial [Lysobacterales bacterium]